jgi:hypothetical protein
MEAGWEGDGERLVALGDGRVVAHAIKIALIAFAVNAAGLLASIGT